MMLTLIVLPNVSSVVSSSRGCCEKTEKKTPPLSGGALIRADRQRESFMRTFSVFFSFFFCLQNATFSWKKQITLRSEKEEEEEVFVVVFCGEKRKVSFMSGVRTRAQKRRRGERDSSLWDLIVNNDDICFQHILPRLNSNDVKFLYEVNTETRKLIKRSSRAKDLKEKFKVEEMSSISTLEFVWENRSLWPRDWRKDESWFCMRVAQTNKLELLKWAREEKKCKWDEGTINRAAEKGNLEMIKYCVAKKCPINRWACAEAAVNGHLECLKYLREEAKAPWDYDTAEWAAKNGHLHILEYLVERKYDKFGYACWYAAEHGHLDCLKYLHEAAKAPWDEDSVRGAYKYKHPECLQYLLDNTCPLPPGWRYEHGTLHTPS